MYLIRGKWFTNFKYIWLRKILYNLTKENDCRIGEQLSLAHSKFFSVFFSDFTGPSTPYLLLKDSGEEVFVLDDMDFVIQSWSWVKSLSVIFSAPVFPHKTQKKERWQVLMMYALE